MSAPEGLDPRRLHLAVHVADPALSLQLVEEPDTTGHLSHIGIEMNIDGARLCDRLQTAGIACECHHDHSWIEAPDNLPWLVYTHQESTR